MQQQMFTATAVDNDPGKALRKIVTELTYNADRALGKGRYRIASVDHSSMLTTGPGQLMVTAIMLVEYT